MNKEIIDLSIIHDVVCDHFKISKIGLFEKTKKGSVTNARQWFHYLSRILNPTTIISSNFIGDYYSEITGNSLNHATVLHSVKTVKNCIDVYKNDAEIETILKNNILKKNEFMKLLKSKVKNQHQQVLWYLINWDSLSLKDVIMDSMFYKFQSRLGEIERDHGIITLKNKSNFINRFNRKSYFTVYKCINKEKAKGLFLLY